MKELLQELGRVSGVIGSFVSNNEGKIVAMELPKEFELDSLNTVSQITHEVFEGIRMSGYSTKQIEFEYENHRLFARKLNKGMLFVLCVRTISLALLNLSFDIVSSKIDALPLEKMQPAGAGKEIDRETFEKIMKELMKPLAKVYGKELAEVALSSVYRKFELFGNAASADDLRVMLLPTLREKYEGIMSPKKVAAFVDEVIKKYTEGEK